MTSTVRGGDRPRLWIVAGPNGCGKSTAYDRSDIDEFGGSVWIINPDLLTRKLVEREGLDLLGANAAALDRIVEWLNASIAAYQTIGVETVLSTPKYRDFVLRAKDHGFEFRLIYLILRSAELQLERIALRAAKGGHDVPADKVRARRERSLRQLPWFLAEADRAWLFDNSGAEAKLIGEKRDGRLWLDPASPADLVHAVTSVG